MTYSQITTLCNPAGHGKVPNSTLSYFRSRNRHRLYSLIIKEFKRSGLSQADLARRLGKGPDIVCRWLASPSNWRLDTVSDLLFAISGAEADYSIRFPLEQATHNDNIPHWMLTSPEPVSDTGVLVKNRHVGSDHSAELVLA